MAGVYPSGIFQTGVFPKDIFQSSAQVSTVSHLNDLDFPLTVVLSEKSYTVVLDQ